MARATLFDPVTRARTAVDVGSQQARDLFAQGYRLETPTQNLQTWNAAPQREIVQGQGTQLLARDNQTGASRPISNPAELSSLVHSGGYQDTRTPLFPSPQSGTGNAPQAPLAGGAGALAPSPGPMGGTAPQAPLAPPQQPRQQAGPNPIESFQAAIQGLLSGVNAGSDQDLMRQRNELINQRFNNVAAQTPANLEMLSPSQNRGLRALENQGVEDRLAGVSSAIQSRDRLRETATQTARVAQDMVKEFNAEQRANREDARNFINDQFTLFGSAAFQSSSDEDVTRLERRADVPAGTLRSGARSIREREAERERTQNQPASVAEYEYYRAQETAAGRTPLSFRDYQAQGGSTGLTPGQVQSTINQITNQFDNEPLVREFNQVAQGYQVASNIVNRRERTSTDDQAMIYAFAKAMDPGSVVREGEYNTVQRYAQSWAEMFGFRAERIFSNQTFLSDDAVRNMAATIGGRFQVSKQAYDNLYSEYNRRIQEARTGAISGSLPNYGAGFGVYGDGTGNGGTAGAGSPSVPASSRVSDDAYIRQIQDQRGVTLTPEAAQRVLMERGQEEARRRQQGLDNAINGSLLGRVGSDTNRAAPAATPPRTGMRTDRHNNPTAFTTDIARVAGLREGVDYTVGDPFSGGQYHTARLTGDPVATTIRVIDRIGFYTQGGAQRWSHTAMPKAQWDRLTYEQKQRVIQDMYRHEGGTQLRRLFA